MANNKKSGPQVTVRVKGVLNPKTKKIDGQPIMEGSQVYKPGETLIIDADRAEALKHVVEFVAPVDDTAGKAA